MSRVKDGLAGAWAETLQGEAGFPFFPLRHDGQTSPPFGVVVVKRLRPTMPGEDVHYAEVRVVVVSDSSDGPSAEHLQRVDATYRAIEKTPRSAKDPSHGVRLCGFLIEDIEPASGADSRGSKVYSDVFMIAAGVAALPDD